MAVSKLTLLGYPLLAWGAVATIGSGALANLDTRFVKILLPLGLLAATAGLVLAIIGAARHEEL